MILPYLPKSAQIQRRQCKKVTNFSYISRSKQTSIQYVFTYINGKLLRLKDLNQLTLNVSPWSSWRTNYSLFFYSFVPTTGLTQENKTYHWQSYRMRTISAENACFINKTELKLAFFHYPCYVSNSNIRSLKKLTAFINLCI